MRLAEVVLVLGETAGAIVHLLLSEGSKARRGRLLMLCSWEWQLLCDAGKGMRRWRRVLSSREWVLGSAGVLEADWMLAVSADQRSRGHGLRNFN
jgi:hypothetical protein